MRSVRRKTVTYHLSKDLRPSALRRFQAFQDHRCRTTTGYKPITVPVERATGLCWVRFPYGESGNRIKVTHGVNVHFLGAAANHTILHPVTDKGVSQANGMGTTCTGRTYAEVDPAQ